MNAKAIEAPPMLLMRKLLSASSRWHIARVRATGRYLGRPVLDGANTNERVAQLLRTSRPMMISRLGMSEIGAWTNYEGIRANAGASCWRQIASRLQGLQSEWSPTVCKTMEVNAGFFSPTPQLLERYALGLEDWLGEADLLAVWLDRWEEVALRRHARQASFGQFIGLEPYLYDNPWTRALAGRRVLVVHPFADSIERQYPHRSKIFGGKEVLPEFELITLKAVQSIAGQRVDYADWFAALEDMQKQIAALQFDVAIIGAGAYGLPLAAFVKRMGRQAVHLGGSTQLLFGIKGRRWDDRPEVTRFYNDCWVRPLPHEVPGNAQSVEQGCYW